MWRNEAKAAVTVECGFGLGEEEQTKRTERLWKCQRRGKREESFEMRKREREEEGKGVHVRTPSFRLSCIRLSFCRRSGRQWKTRA